MQATSRLTPAFELRPHGALKALVAGVLGLYASGLFAMGIRAILLNHGQMTQGTAILWGGAALFALPILLFFRMCMIFHTDEIEMRFWAWSRRLRREEILGWRIQGGAVQLELRDRSKPAVPIGWAKKDDPRLQAWLAGLDRYDPEQQILRELDGPGEERKALLAHTKRLVLAFNVATAIMCGWFMLTGHVAAALLLVAAPVIALVMTGHSSGLIRCEKDYPNPLPGAMMAPMALGLITSWTMTVVSWNELFLLAALGGVFYLAGFWTALPSGGRNLAMIPGLLVLSLIWGYGAGMQLNRHLDMTAPTVHRPEVLSKHIRHGKREHYQLRLSPWGDWHRANVVTIRPASWEQLEPGDTVCIAVHEGALGVAWFDNLAITRCKEQQ